MVISRIENPVITLSLVLLLQSFAGQFYGIYTVVIRRTTIIQLIGLQSLIINIQTMYTLKIIEEQCRYFFLHMRAQIAFIIHYYQRNGIMESLS
jgi:hypothetical protein